MKEQRACHGGSPARPSRCRSAVGKARRDRDGCRTELCIAFGRNTVVKVTVLGCGDAFGAGGRLHSAYLVQTPESTFLVDCGPTILQALKRLRLDPGCIDFVVLSHLHGDHFAGLPFLFMEYRYEAPRTRPLAVYGPRDIARRTQ